MGWRHALLVLALIQLLGPALLYWTCLRDTVSGRQKLARQPEGSAAAYLPLADAFRDSRLWIMAACFRPQIFCPTGMPFHITPRPQDRGYAMAVTKQGERLEGKEEV